MGINYNIETEMCSLRKMCLVSVTQSILETARRDPSTMDNPKFIASKAAEMVPELDLSQTLNTEIIAIIRPVMEEMLLWYKRYGDVVRAILTPHGTVDMAASARAIIASDQPLYKRYVTACEHCLEDDIFNLGKQVTSVMMQKQSNPHANFWYDVYGGHFDVKIIGGSLSQEQVVEVWLLARDHRNISAMRYFQEKTSPKSIQVILNRIWDDEFGYSEFSSITPAFWNTCLHDNALDGEWLEVRKGTISTYLLFQLIEWPYQHLFLESAELLMPNLSEQDFWKIACHISKKLSADYKEYDYKGLFVRFWNLGLTRFKSKLQLVDSEITEIKFEIDELMIPLLKNLFLVKEEFLVSLVFDQISRTDENILYFNCIFSCVCFLLFYVEKYESVEFLMRLFGTKYRELYRKCQNAFNDDPLQAIAQILDYSLNSRLLEDEHDPIIVKYVQFMSKYWVLPELE